MTIAFSCPACGKKYEVDSTRAGRRGRCASCKQEMTVPLESQAAVPQAFEPDTYALDDDGSEVSTYTPPPGDEWEERPSRRRVSSSAGSDPIRSLKRVRPGQFARWRFPLIALGATILVLTILALVFPRMAVVLGGTITVVGILLVLGGFFVGAYVAFTEDFVYGVLYLAIPLFTGWYFVSRFDEMKVQLAAVCLGMVLLAVGGWALEYGHGPVLEDEPGVTVIENDPDAPPPVKPARGPVRPAR